MKVVSVGDISEQVRGVSYSKSESSEEPRPGFVAILRANNITDEGLSFDDLVYVPVARVSPKQRIHAHDVVIAASSGSLSVVGKAAQARQVMDGSFGAFCKVLRPNDDVHPLYFGHFFRTPVYRRTVSGLAAGANINNLKNEHLDNLRIPLPPLPIQKRIAAILDAADALRAKRRESIEQLDSLVQATFLEMFGDPVTNPKGWPTPSGSQISTRITVGIVVKPASYYRPSGVPAFRSLNIRPHRIDTADLVYISEADNAGPLKKSRVWLNDILIVRSGQPGTAAVVTPEFNGVNAIDIIIMTPDLSCVHPAYVCCYLNSDGGKRMVGGAERGQIQKHFNVGALNAAPIPLPPLDLQTRFASIVESIEQQKTRLKAHLAELDTLFASLQSRAFNGELVA